MALRSITHEVINKIDINYLLRFFTAHQLAFVLNTTEDYIHKTRNLQRIESEKNFNKNIYNESDEMKIGRIGSWTLSVERKAINDIKNSENEG